MPELPEVESVRRSLLPLVRGRTITEAILRRPDVVRLQPSTGDAARSPRSAHAASLLFGDLITDIARHGKQLAILGQSGRALVVQLGMTGSLARLTRDESPDLHTHAIWTLDTGERFMFRDPRRFGALRPFASRAALDKHWSSLGLDALTITGVQLHAALAGSKRAIKAALLDQSVLAGVGNIYADESLFLSGINPRFRADRLSAAHVDSIAASIREILTRAVSAGGSTIRDYANADGNPGSYQSRHAVYGRAGLPCPNCGTALSTALLAQRTTVWCRVCQPARPKPPR